jgi:bifunctional DNA-binding transcriptional regulator/antitoxin component of YhaV-PrlF toxin-antitoxin module
MIKSKLTGGGRTTLPKQVRDALRLSPVSELLYTLEGHRVVIAKHSPLRSPDPFFAFLEWDSEADRAAYCDL